MSLVVGQNSWVTVLEADAYLTDRVGATEWFLLPVDENDSAAEPGGSTRSALLVTAFRWIKSSPQVGELPSVTDDENFRAAQIEAALHLMKWREDLENRQAMIASGVSSFSLGKRRESLDSGQMSLPSHVLTLLASLTQKGAVVDLRGEYDV